MEIPEFTEDDASKILAGELGESATLALVGKALAHMVLAASRRDKQMNFQTGRITEIEKQTRKTNGRVDLQEVVLARLTQAEEARLQREKAESDPAIGFTQWCRKYRDVFLALGAIFFFFISPLISALWGGWIDAHIAPRTTTTTTVTLPSK